MDDGHVNCPQGRRVITRRAEQTKWRRGPRWKKMLADHAHIPEAECAVCHRKHGQVMTYRNGNIKYDKKGNEKHVVLTINHTDRICYLDEELYLTWNPARMRVECTTCNWMYEQGKIPCPDCLKKGIVVYIKWDQECCDACFYEKHPDILQRIVQKRIEQGKADKEYREKRNAKSRALKREHPCTYHGMGQKCRIQFRGCLICPYAKTKAKNCQGFKIKKGAVKKPVFKQSVKFAAFLSFPCRFRLKEQHCEKGGICGYSKENYQKCRQAQERPARRK